MSQGYKKNDSLKNEKINKVEHPSKKCKAIARGIKSPKEGLPPQTWGMKVSFKKKGRK